MYDELIKSLRICSRCDFGQDCNECKQKSDDAFCCDKLLHEAADVIEELERENERLHADLGKAIRELAKQPSWIPVTEREPEQGDPLSICLIVGGKYDQLSWYELCDYAEGQFWIQDHLCDCHVTHWMPLPEPPKDDEA